jgi:DNA polymerase-3 subunit delta'
VGWQNVRGHDDLVEGFRRVMQRGRLAHAYLFAGPAGVGKRLFAVELARALLCEARPESELDACGSCASCQLVHAGTHPDLFLAGKPADSMNLPIEVVRELSRNLALKPARGGRKIAVLDDADDLNDPPSNHAAANAFLKTLEEPPPRSVLILVGTQPDLQLPTILSRAQRIRFRPLPAELVDEVLRARGVKDQGTRQRLVRLAGGSPGTALALADAELWKFREALVAGLTASPIDSVQLAAGWLKFIEAGGKDPAAKRGRAQAVLRLLVDLVDDALAVGAGGPARRTGLEDRAAVEALARREPEVLLSLLDRCLEADEQVDRRVQLELVLEALLDALAQKLAA